VAVQAIVADPDVPATMHLHQVQEPSPGPGQVVIAVQHISLNFGDLNDARSGRVPPGAVLGSDVAGVVTQAAGNGTGPRVETRVVALANGGFAQRIAVDADSVAAVPPTVDLSHAAALPVAGLAALRALRACGSVLAKRVLITGASGGVGSYAVQLASSAGAHVIASVGSAARGRGLREEGAADVVIGLNGIDQPVDAILDTVGGPQMVEAWGLLAPGGSLQSIGWTSGQPAVFPAYATIGPAKTLSSYLTYGPVGADLRTLVDLLAAGDLVVKVGWRGGWDQVSEAVSQMRDRKVNGKAVLDVPADTPDPG
jgi:NADPH:quinone reductase-like Zn-dependent oxidoreductase